MFVLLAFGMVASFVSFDFNSPFNGQPYTYNGFVNSISLGLDLKGGALAVYEASPIEGDSNADMDSRINATKARLQSLLTGKGFPEAVVSSQGNRIRVEVPDVADPQAIFNIIGQPASLEIKDVNDINAAPILTGRHIRHVYATMQNGEPGVVIEFTPEGSTLFFEMTSNLVGQSTYIFINGKLESSPTVNSAIAGGSTFISGGSMNNLEEAEKFATMILSGTFSVNLKLIENAVISATLGQEALQLAIIAGAIGFLLVLLFMAFVYRGLGVVAGIALLFYFVLMLFFLQAIPLVQLTLPGIAGIILSIGMAVDGNIIMFERIKDEYRLGKRIPAAVNAGFKKSLGAIVDASLTTLIVAFVLLIFGTGAIQGLAITLIIGITLSMFTSLVVTRTLIKLYLPINSTNAKTFGLRREEGEYERA